MSLLIDEFGRPIILFDSTNTKERLKGVEAYRVRNNYILKILSINNIVKYLSSMWSSKFFAQFNGPKRNG